MDDYVVDIIMTYIRFLGIATKTIWHEKYTGELKTRFKKKSGGGVISQTDILDPIISTVIRILDFNSHYEMISYFQKCKKQEELSDLNKGETSKAIRNMI